MFQKFLLLLLVVTYATGTTNNISYPDAVYPKSLTREDFKKACPSRSGRIDHCLTDYEGCFGLLRPFNDCNKDFCDCVLDDQSELECRKYSDDACFAVKSRRNIFQKEIVKQRTQPAVDKINKKLKPMLGAYNEMLKDCGVESKIEMEVRKLLNQMNSTNALLDSTMSFFAMYEIEPSLLKSDKCRISINNFHSALEEADSKNAQNLKIPYNFWFLGSEYGPIGRVITRILAYEVCGKASLDFNHDFAEYLNCCDQRETQLKCTEDYTERITRTLKTKDSSKLICKMFVDLLKSIHDVRSDKFYQEASEYYVQSSKTKVDGKFNEGYQAVENGSLTKRDTKSLYLELEASEKSTVRISHWFDKVSSECVSVKNSPGPVVSCGFQYENCIHHVRSECQTKFSICLSGIDGIRGRCGEVIDKYTKILNPTRIGSVITRKTATDVVFWLVTALSALFFFFIIAYMAVRYRGHISERLCNKSTSTSNETELGEVPNQEDVPKTVEEETPLIVEHHPDVFVEDNMSQHNVDVSVNNSNVPVIPTELSNNQEEPPPSMKYDEHSVIPIYAGEHVPSTSNSDNLVN